MLLSDGNGGLARKRRSRGRASVAPSRAGDYNNDGNVDAAIEHVRQQHGHFPGKRFGALGLWSPTRRVRTYAITTADIDGDGDLDLVTSNFGTADWTVYENVGGVFVNPRTLPSDRSGSCAVLYDGNNDGDIDLAGFDEIHDWIYFYKNPGAPTGITPSVTTAALEQNHPNPFNPTTSIRFELARAADITLAVYNTGGEFVARIACGHYAAGRMKSAGAESMRAGRGLRRASISTV